MCRAQCFLAQRENLAGRTEDEICTCCQDKGCPVCPVDDSVCCNNNGGCGICDEGGDNSNPACYKDCIEGPCSPSTKIIKKWNGKFFSTYNKFLHQIKENNISELKKQILIYT